MRYATYIAGKDALFYSPEFMAALKAEMVFHTPYRSNWRILHVDGFEDGIHPLPARTGKPIQFVFRDQVKQQAAPGPRVMYSDLQRQLDYQDARDRGSL